MKTPEEMPTPVLPQPKDDGSNNDGRVFGRTFPCKPEPDEDD